jgi:hypothetical protein
MRFEVLARAGGFSTLAEGELDASRCNMHRREAAGVHDIAAHRTRKSTSYLCSAFTSRQQRDRRRYHTGRGRAGFVTGQSASVHGRHAACRVAHIIFLRSTSIARFACTMQARATARPRIAPVQKQRSGTRGITTPAKRWSSQGTLHRRVIGYTCFAACEIHACMAHNAATADMSPPLGCTALAPSRVRCRRSHHTGWSAGFGARQPAPVWSDRQALSRRHRRVAAFAKAADGTGRWREDG